ncbi:CLUMA_CG009007, isoform A [Clunio marinus]|uniref:CLUMA_CG009007, isoform A n=1 Tax=Clunio marinus TaxID=568069 RepID=A0A1J1I997_9DIPT|nr:CLUMA_CG009007, isoform A [Clunio marinus]
MSVYGDYKRLSPIDELKSPTVHLIREIYDGENAHDNFILDLDRALVEKYDYIIVEPAKVADETSRWIIVGNCLHKTAVLSGIASTVSAFVWPRNIAACASVGFVSLFCSTLYAVSWDTDPCVQYQIEKNPKKLPRFPNLNDFTSPVVLKYKSNKKKKYFHRSLTTIAIGVCVFRIYELLK